MSEPIELTREERSAAREALREASSTGYSFGIALDKAVAAANRVRAGDPVGTVRRHPLGCTAVLTEAGWIWVGRDGDHAESGPLTSERWTVVYSPQEES